MVFSPDGKQLATVPGPLKRAGEVKIWDSKTGKEKLTLTPDAPFNINSVVFSPDGKWVATGCGDHKTKTPGEIKVWNAETGAEQLTLTGHSAFVTGLCFSPDGTKLVSGSGDKTVKVWDISSLDASP